MISSLPAYPYFRSRTASPRVSPFFTWHWLLALVLLVVNDHLLKGSDWLPAWFTGKLSDFVGLYVAPVLVAALCGAVGRFPWGLCHVAVGVVFAALKLSPEVARVAETAAALLGIGWRVMPDPTDLYALPMLALSFWALCPAMKQQRLVPRLLSPARAGHLVFLTLGSSACLASSVPNGPAVYETSGPALRNETQEVLEVRILQLQAESIDCEMLQNAPGRSFPASAFGQAVRFSLEPNENAPIDQTDIWDHENWCSAALVDVNGGRQQLVFWDTGRVQSFEPQTEKRPGTPQLIVAIEAQEDSGTTELREVLSDAKAAHTLFDFEPRFEVSSQCETTAISQLWIGNVPHGTHTLSRVTHQSDGCTRLGFGYEERPQLDAPALDPEVTAQAPRDAVAPVRADAGTELALAADPGAPTADAGLPISPDPVATTPLNGFANEATLPPAEYDPQFEMWVCAPAESVPFTVGDSLVVQMAPNLALTLSTAEHSLTLFTTEGTSHAVGSAMLSRSPSGCPVQVSETGVSSLRAVNLFVTTDLGRAELAVGKTETFSDGARTMTAGNLGSVEVALSNAPIGTAFLAGYLLERILPQ